MKIVVVLHFEKSESMPMEMNMSGKGFWQWIREDFFKKITGKHFTMDFLPGPIKSWSVKKITIGHEREA